MNKNKFIEQLIIKEKILPLFYDDSVEVSIEILKTLYASGIKLVEYTNRGANALSNFTALRNVNTEVAQFVHNAGLLWVPGCLTPTEIFTAEANEATIVKIFPGNLLGPSYIFAIKELFPDLLFMPTGGVDVSEESFYKWFNAGACAVGLGSKLISRQNLEEKNYTTIKNLATEALKIIAGIK